ncbi:hypothetical protein JHK87_025064 [Glycine soja]|nr:hypothetical protein JHK87_025064 [Glycine soja]
MALDFESAKDGDLTVMSNGSPKRTFKFDVVFGPRQAKQGDIFEDAAPFATSVLDGFNVCIFAYGQTRTGGQLVEWGMHENQVMVEDLAGSERVAKTEVHGNRLKETQNINRSLSALGDVISALATKSSHIPFRNSNLTHLLQHSLGAHSNALMFVQINSNENYLSETIFSLNFASRVRGIELGSTRKQLDTIELLRHKQMLEKVKQEVKLKDLQMKKLEETIHGLESKMKERDNKNKNLQEKVKEPESQLLVERKLARQHVDSKIVEQHQMKHQEKQNNTLLRLALASRPLGSLKNFNDPVNGGWFKDQQINSAKPPTKKIILKPCIPISTMETSIKCIDHAEKENNGDMADKALLPKRLGRPSICMMTPHVPSAVASRRNSLIRLPSIPSLTQFQSPLLPKLTNQFDQKDANGESETNCVLAQTHFLCPKEVRSGAKRIGSILRRSLHKKIQVKSPFQQHMRKVGVNVGMEKVRVSIGSRGDW